MKKTFLALVAMLSAASVLPLAAQTKGTNLLTNGSFEKYKGSADAPMRYRYEGWSISDQIFAQEAAEAQDGSKAIKMYVSSGGSITPINDKLMAKTFEIGTAKTFTLSFWHKGVLRKPNLATIVKYYNASDLEIPIREIQIPGSQVPENQSSWAKKVVEIPTTVDNLPEGSKPITHISFYIEVRSDYRDRGEIAIDNFSLVKSGEAAKVEIKKPQNVKAQAFEREVELSWEPSLDKDISWEVTVAGKTYTTKTPSYIVAGLEPKTPYSIEVRTVKGAEKSEAETIKGTTQSLYKDASEDTRLPYLRTITRTEGNTGKVLNLFYNGLVNSNAKFTYWVDGQQVTPTNHQLTFDSTGKKMLKIKIEESASDIFILNYIIQVNN